MSLKNSYTTSDYLQWDSATNLVRKLYRDKEYRISLLIGCGIFFGLRISDLLQLTWEMLLNKNAKFIIIEKKTGKRREVRINREFQKHIKDCYVALGIQNLHELCFLSGRSNKAYSIQWVNIVLKELKEKYSLKIDHFSTHSLRKTFGRRVFEASGEHNAELALVKLMELFNHSSVTITKRYLGLRQEEILQTYDCLSF
jgi:integrase